MTLIDRLTFWRRPRGANPAGGHDSDTYVWFPSPFTEPEAKLNAGPLFPRFQTTAGDQLDTGRVDRFAVARAKLRDTYTPAQPVTDRRLFAGRTKVLTTLIRAIEDQRLHAVIYGERGVGKTSLLHVLAEAARDARYLVVYVTCGAESEFNETMLAVADAIPLMYHDAYGPTSPEAERGDTLQGLLGGEAITVRSATDALAKVAGTRVLVVLDEFDRAASQHFRRSIAELLKSLSDRSVRVQFLIAGVAANLTELVANVPSIQRNVFALQVPKMSAAEIRHLVKNGEGAIGLTFDDSAVHAIIGRSIGSPYLATLMSQRSALVAIDDGRMHVTGEDVVTATGEAVDEFKGRITRRSQQQIDERVRKGMIGALGALGGAAQSSGGAFTIEDLHLLHLDAATLAHARTVADRLAEEKVLLEVHQDEFNRSYRFLEDNVPAYLWLLAAKGHAMMREPEFQSAAV